MNSPYRCAIVTSAALLLSLPMTAVAAETYLVSITAQIDQTIVADGGSLPAHYAIGETLTGVFEIESSRTRHVKGARAAERGTMLFTRTPKKLSFDGPGSLSFRNGRLLVTPDGAVQWGNADSYCRGYAASRNLLCSASGSVEVSQEASGDRGRSFVATNFSFAQPGGMDPILDLQPALEKIVSLASDGDSTLVLGFSDKKGLAEQDQVKLMMTVKSMAFKVK